VVREARTKIDRRLGRTESAPLETQRPLPHPVPVLLHVRRGLESLLVSELGSGVAPRVAGDGRVEVVSAAPLERWFRARTFLHLGFPLPSEQVSPASVDDAVVRALTSEAAWDILSTLSGSRIRYRLEWASAGRKRSATFRVAERVAAARPLLVNDPANAPWEAVVTEREAQGGVRVFVELWPRGFVDPRFSYRKKTLPASSHPTLAAALALVAGARPDDVVWDPFAGSGIELCERALLGPYARLIGTDTDEAALELARENLTAASAKRFELVTADARTYTPSVPPTLIVTNPPFGRRVLHRDDLPELFAAFLRNAARVLDPSGRVVWMSPDGKRTAELAAREGLTVRSRRDVDVGGIRAEMQELVPSGTPPRRFSRKPG
jgi:predicted RNA methylase